MITLYISHSWSICLSVGFIFINCTLPDGTNISQWVFSANNTLCIDPTTTPPMITNITGKKTGITVSIKPSNQTVTNSSSDDPWYSHISKWKLTLLQWIHSCHFLFSSHVCLHENTFHQEHVYWKICVSLVSFITKTCYLPVLAGVLSALVILLIVGVAVVCSHKKKQNNKPKGTKFLLSLLH